MMTYSAVHQMLRNTIGSASEFTCDCGEPAEDWAYQHSAGERELRSADGTTPYSEDSADYAPMCRTCHIQFDIENDIARQIRRSDPVFQAAMVERGTYVGTLKAEMMQADPEFAERMREASVRGAKTMAQRMQDDPAYGDPIRAVRRANMKKVGDAVSRIRRQCSECDLISSPGGMGRHHQISGHEGWTQLEEED